MAASKFRVSSSSFTAGADFSGSVFFHSDVTVSGTLNVFELKSTLVSSSIIFKSGSTRFGDDANDTHTFTGTGIFSNTVSGSIHHTAAGISYLVGGDNITVASSSNGQVTINATAAQEVFKTISVAGQDDVVADSATDTLTIAAAGGMTITTTAGTDTVTFSSADTNTQNTTTLSFVDSSNDIILRNTTGGAGSGTDDIKFVAGSNITLTHTDADNITIASSAGSVSTANVVTALNDDLGGDVTFGTQSDDTISFVGPTRHNAGLSGSLTQLPGGTSYLIAGTNVTITSASNGAVTIASTSDQNVFSTIAVSGQTNVVADAATDTLTFAESGGMTITTTAGTDTVTFSSANTTYTAGDGLDLGGTEFSLDLKSSGGLKIVSTELAIEPANFAGTGLEDDGSDNLRLSTAAAGNGLSGGGGSALSLDLNGLSAATAAVAADSIVIIDADDNSSKKESISDLIDSIAGTTSATALSASSGVLTVNINSLTADSNAGNLADSIIISDNSDSNANKKITLTQLKALVGTDTNTQNTTTLSFVDSTDDIILRNTTGGATSSTQDIKLVAGANVTLTHTDANNFTIAGTNTTYTAGTGIDLSGTEFAVDVSDFMTNGSDNRVVTATGADAMNAEANLTFDGTDLSVSGKVKTTGIEYTDGDEAITVQDGGYIKYESGVTHSPAVRVNTASTATNNQWIKIAESTTSTDGDTIITNLLVTVCGQELGTDVDPAMYCSFLVHAEFTPKNASPYHYAAGTALIVDTFSQNNLIAWDPRADIFISYEEDSTPLHNLYIRVKEANKDVYVTHLGGTDTDGLLRTDPAMNICTGQSFQAGGVDTFSLGEEIYGQYASKILTGLTVLGANATSPSTMTIGNDVDDYDRLLVFGHATNKVAIGLDDSTDKFAINSGGVLSAGSDFQMDATGNAEFKNGNLFVSGSLTLGEDNDGTDQKIIFGHSTLKSVIGISDANDVFAINTDDDFEAGNDFEINTSGEVSFGNGGITVAGKMLPSADDTHDIGSTTAAWQDLYLEGNMYFTDAGSIDTTGTLTIEASGDIKFTHDSTQRIQIEDTTGDIAIGTHDPTYRLDVQESGSTFVVNIENTVTDDSDADLLRMKHAMTGFDGQIIYVYAGAGSIYTVTADGDGTSTVSTTFTGFHDTACLFSSDLIPGMIVESTGVPWVKNPVKNYHNMLPYTKISQIDGSKTVFGVTAKDNANKIYTDNNEKIVNPNLGGLKPGEFPGLVNFNPMEENNVHISVMSLGEGAVWVTNINGSITNGDLIESSAIAGYGRLQPDDIMRSKTVAKCTESINWDLITDTIVHEGITYKKYLTSCTFHCG